MSRLAVAELDRGGIGVGGQPQRRGHVIVTYVALPVKLRGDEGPVVGRPGPPAGGTFTSLDGPGGSARWQRGRNAWQAARHVLGHLPDE